MIRSSDLILRTKAFFVAQLVFDFCSATRGWVQRMRVVWLAQCRFGFDPWTYQFVKGFCGSLSFWYFVATNEKSFLCTAADCWHNELTTFVVHMVKSQLYKVKISVKKQTVSPDFILKTARNWSFYWKACLFSDSTKRTHVAGAVNKNNIKI